jgi:D-alanyl-D-alanine carboxypeptidase (penicillin-binding protein 5/6)
MKAFLLRHRRLVAVFAIVGFIALLASGAYLQYQRPIPEVRLVREEAEPAPPAAPVEVAWPGLGQASIAIAGVGVIGESPNQTPSPIASLVKVMTAYVVLKNHPLNPGEPGPEVEFNQTNVDNYRVRSANAESIVAVTAGSKMNQRELLRGLLLASGNNLADVLAEWHAGSVEAFVAEMNAEAQALGMTQTIYADAAGLLSSSVSTAHDQMVLANAAMADPTFAAIVREAQASLPGVGVIYNTNSELGTDGIIGVKTGWTEEAGACFIFAAERQVEDRTVTVIGAVLGQTTLADAFARSRELIAVGGSHVSVVHAGSEGDVVGRIESKWGDGADAVLAQDVRLLIVPGVTVQEEASLNDAAEISEGAEIGVIRYTAGSQQVEVPLKATAAIGDPDLRWRLMRIR